MPSLVYRRPDYVADVSFGSSVRPAELAIPQVVVHIVLLVVTGIAADTNRARSCRPDLPDVILGSDVPHAIPSQALAEAKRTLSPHTRPLPLQHRVAVGANRTHAHTADNRTADAHTR